MYGHCRPFVGNEDTSFIPLAENMAEKVVGIVVNWPDYVPVTLLLFALPSFSMVSYGGFRRLRFYYQMVTKQKYIVEQVFVKRSVSSKQQDHRCCMTCFELNCKKRRCHDVELVTVQMAQAMTHKYQLQFMLFATFCCHPPRELQFTSHRKLPFLLDLYTDPYVYRTVFTPEDRRRFKSCMLLALRQVTAADIKEDMNEALIYGFHAMHDAGIEFLMCVLRPTSEQRMDALNGLVNTMNTEVGNKHEEIRAQSTAVMPFAQVLPPALQAEYLAQAQLLAATGRRTQLRRAAGKYFEVAIKDATHKVRAALVKQVVSNDVVGAYEFANGTLLNFVHRSRMLMEATPLPDYIFSRI